MKNLIENIKQYEYGRILDRSEASRLHEVVEAWGKSPYLRGLKGRDLGRMAILAENQKREILKENNTTADMAVFDTIAIPMIRRQNALMVTPNLISVQPLSYPNGVVFYLDYQVSTTKNPHAAHYLSETPGNEFDEGKSGYDRHYDNQGYDNTKGRVIPRGYVDATGPISDGDSTNTTVFRVEGVDLGTGTGVISVAVVDLNFTSIGGITMDNIASLQIFIEDKPNLIQGRDYFIQKSIQNWSDPIFSTGREFPTGQTNPPYTTSGDSNSQNRGPASTGNGITGPGIGNKIVRIKIIPATSNIGTVNLRVGFKQYLNLELNPAFSSELKLKISSAPIETSIHKMKTAWTVELSQDLMAYHAIDAEAELTQLMAEETAAEKDRLIIRELVTLAAHFETWNADFANAVNPNPAETVFRGHEGIYNQTLMFALNRANAKIQKSTRKGGANWVLISAEGAAKIQNLDVYKPFDVNEEGTKFSAGVEKIGTLNQKWVVYVDPQLPAEICLMGRKGSSFFDTGYVYCPYVEYMLSAIVLDPQTYNPSRQISSRFGTAMLNNKFYAVVYMKGIEKIDVFMEPTTV